jgi:hypothetical protein
MLKPLCEPLQAVPPLTDNHVRMAWDAPRMESERTYTCITVTYSDGEKRVFDNEELEYELGIEANETADGRLFIEGFAYEEEGAWTGGPVEVELGRKAQLAVFDKGMWSDYEVLERRPKSAD